MRVAGLSGDLAWWRETRDAPDTDPAALRELLERLRDWKAQHDADRALQPGPFFKMVWDGIFADDDSDVVETIAEVEQALSGR
jgi:hypothetical protein